MKFKDDIVTATSGGGGGENYLRLKDKETVTGIFRGEIKEYYLSWPKGGRKQIFSEPAPGTKIRFEVNFVVKEGTTYVPKIFEGGHPVYKQLAALHDEYDLEKTVIKITRNGIDKNTSYTFMPAKVAPSAETLKYLDSIQLLPLVGETPTSSAANPPNEESF